jgi:DNA-binding CsgD family transcriptional regulator
LALKAAPKASNIHTILFIYCEVTENNPISTSGTENLYFGIVYSILWDSVFGLSNCDICIMENDLTAKEQAILKLVSEGLTSEQIAEQMCLSLPTIKWYRKKLRTKFEANTSVEMVRKAMKQGLI